MHLVAPSNTLLNNGLLFNKVFAEIIVYANKRKFLDEKKAKIFFEFCQPIIK